MKDFKIKAEVIANFNDSKDANKPYEIGDEIMYDGRIIDPEHPLTRKLEKMIVGTITCIPEDNTDYVSVFKV